MIPEHSVPTEAPRLRITVAPAGDAVRLVLAGELDAEEVDGLRDAAAAALRCLPGRSVSVDAAELNFLDSSGIRGLLTCRRLAAQAGCGFTIDAISVVAHQVLQITGLLETFDVADPHLPRSVCTGIGQTSTASVAHTDLPPSARV